MSGKSVRRALIAVVALVVGAVPVIGMTPAAAAASTAAVVRVSPNAGRTAGGTTVTVLGRGFTHVSKVLFGSKTGSRLHVVSSTKLVVHSPEHSAGSVDIRVVTSDGKSAAGTSDRFAYLAPPSVTAVSLASAASAQSVGGTRVSVRGTGFTRVTRVLFGATAGSAVIVASTTKLTVTAPAHAVGQVDVRVVTSFGTSPVTNKDHYTYIDTIAPPAITKLSATSVRGSIVTLAWTNPATNDYTGVTIRRAVGTTAPATVSDGTAVADVRAPIHSFSDGGLTPSTTYSYALFAHDAAGNRAARVTVTATTGLTAPSFAGTVTAAATGDPVAGVDVVVTDIPDFGVFAPTFPSTGLFYNGGGTLVGVAGADGSYFAVGPYVQPYHRYQVCLDPSNVADQPATGYVSSCRPSDLSLATDERRTGVNLTLTVGGAVSGTITNSLGAPVPDLPVSLYSTDGNSFGAATTAADGTYTALGLAPNSYVVCVNAPTSPSASVCYGGSPVTPVTVTSAVDTSGIDLTVAAADPTDGSITGTVTDSAGHPLSGINVEASPTDFSAANATSGGSATTDAAGHYEVGGLLAGSYGVCFETFDDDPTPDPGTGYLEQCYDNTTEDDSTPVTVTTGAATPGIDAHLTSGAVVTGRVTDSHGEPLTGVWVSVVDPTPRDEASNGYGGDSTDADGNYRITGLPVQKVGVCFDPTEAVGGTSTSGYVATCYDRQSFTTGTPTAVALTAGATRTIDAALLSSTSPLGSISGRVTDKAGHPLALVDVQFTPAGCGDDCDGASVFTAADGTYNTGPLASGSYTVCFSDENEPDPTEAITGGTSSTGYGGQCYNDTVAAHPTKITVSAGTTTTNINAKLAPGGAIRGTVTDPSNQPVADAFVTVWSNATNAAGNSTFWETQTAADGTYEVDALAAGTYQVCFQAEETLPQTTNGLLDQCYNGVDEADDDSKRTPVTVTVATVTTGIDAHLKAGGVITGTVTDNLGHPLGDIPVQVTSVGGFTDDTMLTNPDGTYADGGLSPGKYNVCFDGELISGGSKAGPRSTAPADTQYTPQCYNDVVWDGASAPPAKATKISVTYGVTVPDIDAQLKAA